VLQVLLVTTVQAINDASCYAIMMDSSTDITGEDHVMIYTQYVDSEMTVRTDYLCTVKVSTKTADAVFAVLMAVLKALGLDPSKLVAFATDGGSEYMGSETGVGKQLRNVCPYLVHTHCIAHRAALVMSDQSKAAKEVAPDNPGSSSISVTLCDVEQLVTDVHALFNRSSKRTSAWKGFARRWLPGYVTRFKFPLFNSTRWLSRFDCLEVLCHNAPALIAFLRLQPRWQKGQSVLKRLEDPNLLLCLMGMRDVVSHMNEFTTNAQADGILPHSIKVLVDELCETFRKLLSVDHQSLAGPSCFDTDLMPVTNNFFQRLSSNGAKGKKKAFSWLVKSKSFRFKSISLAAGELDWSTWFATTKFLIDGIYASVYRRFPQSTEWKMWRSFDAGEYAGQPHSTLANLFKPEFKAMMGHYKKMFPNYKSPEFAEEAKRQFLKYKSLMHELVRQFPKLRNRQYWAMLRRDHSATIPVIVRLALVMFTIPVQSATVERGFSMHRVFKHRLTNSLRLVTLDALMRVKLLGPREDVCEFDFDAAAEVVKAKGGLNGDHPSMFGRLHKAASDLDVPEDILDGCDLERDPALLDVVSDSDSDYEPGEGSDDDCMSEISYVSEGEEERAQQGDDDDLALDSDKE
jgi:hAT family C-terminal dimerisation region